MAPASADPRQDQRYALPVTEASDMFESSDEDEEEAFTRKRTACKPIKLPKAPEGASFRSWMPEALTRGEKLVPVLNDNAKSRQPTSPSASA